jgi:hypothetical protein
VSARSRRLRLRIGAWLIDLDHTAWRARYRTEILALIEDDPPGPRGLASLLAGAADAHLRPRSTWRLSVSPAVRMRLSGCAAFCCWIAMSLMGAGFQALRAAYRRRDRKLAARASGPVGASTGAMLGAQAFLAALACSLGLLGALRARRAAAELI